MTAELAAGILLIAVPLAFNAAFFELGRVFDYPDILRRDPDEILRRFAAGGAGLLLRWEVLLLSALAMLPLVVVFAIAIGANPVLGGLGIAVGSAAALVQAVGLARWPFVVPELARRYLAATGEEGRATRESIAVVFAAIHRLFGVAIGEHLGYLLTGSWTLLAAASIATTTVIAPWLGVAGVPIGIALLVGSLEFVGPNEADGWRPAGVIVPVAYVAWSVWLVAVGVALLV